MKYRLVTFTLSILGLLFGSVLCADDTSLSACEEALVEAEAAYRSGRLEVVESVLVGACVEDDARRDQRARAHELLAKAYLALDQATRARRSVEDLLAQDSTFTPTRQDPLPFVRLVASIRDARDVVTVASVSKTDEPLAEAPATVVVVTAEQIERRGYTDLEQVFHDLPGFDISRSNGITYSNLYQRGFRSNFTDRTLFLVDGVEQNDLWSNIAYISRQYPVSNIERIEVVYGPASTIYGANAYAGVIQVITKSPDSYFEDDPSKSFHTSADLGFGPNNTRWAEATVAGKSGSLTYAITARQFRSDEQDLSRFEDWNFDLSVFDYKAILTITGQSATDSYGQHQEQFDTCEARGWCNIRRDDAGRVIEITPTDAGVQKARDEDQTGYETLRVDGVLRPATFEDTTDDWLVSGRLKLPSFTAGFDFWRRDEGASPMFSDSDAGAAPARWVPESLSFYLKYSHTLSETLRLQIFSRYKWHELEPDSTLTNFNGYASGDFPLSDLGRGELRETSWGKIGYSQSSSEVRNEVSLFFDPSDRFGLVAGLERRDAAIQEDLDRDSPEQLSPILNSETSGFYVQATYRPWHWLKLIGGGRLDENTGRENPGYGSVFNSRFGVVVSPVEDWMLKAVFSEAFKDPSNFERFGTLAGILQVSNPDLEPERVENLEISAIWNRGDEASLEFAAFESEYSRVVTIGNVGLTARRENLGRLSVRGIQIDGHWRLSNRIDWAGNYTYIDPKGILGSEAAVRVGDIARHRLNLEGNLELMPRWNFNLRLHYVGARPRGIGTTVQNNLFRQVDEYTSVDFNLRYSLLPKWGAGEISIFGWNLLDKSYDHPGVLSTNDSFAALLPQPSRSVGFRISFTR